MSAGCVAVAAANNCGSAAAWVLVAASASDRGRSRRARVRVSPENFDFAKCCFMAVITVGSIVVVSVSAGHCAVDNRLNLFAVILTQFARRGCTKDEHQFFLGISDKGRAKGPIPGEFAWVAWNC